jgi:predicted nucleic acid-binding protein
VRFLLDTNVVSEWTKPQPDGGVATFLAEQDEDSLFLSVVTLAGLRRGVQRLPEGRRHSRLDAWLRDELPARFTGRLLGIDAATADAWGRIIARRERAGRPMGIMDGWIAAIAVVHGLGLVTRNELDFAAAVDHVVNPWTESRAS